MKKYLIKINGLANFEFSLPIFKGRKSEIISKLLLTLGVISFFLFIVTLPFSNLFIGKTFEESSFDSLIFFMCLSIGLFGSFFLLQGKKVLVDPKYFLSVLFFALLTTAASVLKSPAHISNTFGIELVRSLSGITIMALVGLFYFINFLAKDSKMLNRLSKAFSFSLSILILILIFHTNITDTSFVNSNLPIVLFAYFYLGLCLIFSKSQKVLMAILLSISAIFIFLTPQTIPDSIISTQVITVGVLSAIVLGLVYAIIKKEYVKKKVSELKTVQKGFKDKKYSLSEVSYFLLLSVSVIAILVGVLVHFRFNFTLDILINPINSLVSAVKAPFTGTFSITKLLIGNGSFDTVNRISNLDSSISSISNVFVTQGLVGTLAYLFILVTGLFALLKSVKKSLILRSNRGLVFLSAFIMLFVSLFSFVTYSGELFTIFWWFSFASFTVFLGLKDLKVLSIQKDWSVNKIILKNKFGIYLRVILSLLLVLVSILALLSFSRITV